jgi:hypothetical protein
VTDLERIEHIEENLSDEQTRELVRHRGGCRCHLCPPCHACSEPLTIPEAEELGWWQEEGAGSD